MSNGSDFRVEGDSSPLQLPTALGRPVMCKSAECTPMGARYEAIHLFTMWLHPECGGLQCMCAEGAKMFLSRGQSWRFFRVHRLLRARRTSRNTRAWKPEATRQVAGETFKPGRWVLQARRRPKPGKARQTPRKWSPKMISQNITRIPKILVWMLKAPKKRTNKTIKQMHQTASDGRSRQGTNRQGMTR